MALVPFYLLEAHLINPATQQVGRAYIRYAQLVDGDSETTPPFDRDLLYANGTHRAWRVFFSYNGQQDRRSVDIPAGTPESSYRAPASWQNKNVGVDGMQFL